MADRALTDWGSVQNVDPYQCYGRGLPEGWEWLSDLTPDQALAALPAIVRDFDERLRRLEETR